MARGDFPSAKQAQFNLRLPSGMRERIAEKADSSGRSMNSEIVALLAFALEENIWERQKFIDTLNFKQHVIDKQMHILFAEAGEKQALKDAVTYERALRSSVENTLAALCRAVLTSSLDDETKAVADRILSSDLSSPAPHDREALKYEVSRKVGDLNDIEADWETTLSEDDAEKLAESRKWGKGYE